MTDPKAAICYLNGLTLKTINDVEQVLLSLPQTGNKCKLQVVKPVPMSKEGGKTRGTADVVTPGSMQIRDLPKPLTLSPPTRSARTISSSDTSVSSRTSTKSTNSCRGSRRKVECRAITSVLKECKREEFQTPPHTPSYKVLTDKIRVSPILAVNGVVLDIDVEITMSETGDKKVVKLEIECPNYVPARIKIGGKWKKIV